MESDPGAEYVKVIEIDASAIRPMAALPNDPGNGVFIDDLEATRSNRHRLRRLVHGGQEGGHGHVRPSLRGRDAARGTSGVGCSTSSTAPSTCASTAARRGTSTSSARGRGVHRAWCGACINAGPGVSYAPDKVTISSLNRNFPGRSGPGQLYLASPYTTAASAVAGYIVRGRGTIRAIKGGGPTVAPYDRRPYRIARLRHNHPRVRHDAAVVTGDVSAVAVVHHGPRRCP